jgi:hypothetical protein
LLYYPPTKSFFEIKFVEHERPFYQLNNLVVYQLQCELFEYSNETFETGNSDIDIIQTNNAISLVAEIRNPIGTANFTKDFVIGEIVAQGLSGGVFIFAEITNLVIDEDGAKLVYLSNITTSDAQYHEFQEGVRIAGQVSLVTYTLHKLYDLDDQAVNQMFPNDNSSQNFGFEVGADSIIDFSESNPFGDPSLTLGGNSFTSPDNPLVDRGLFLVSTGAWSVDTTLITVDKE